MTGATRANPFTLYLFMKEADSGLVRYRGRLEYPAMVSLLKASNAHNKARKYARKGVDPATISPCVADVSRLGPSILPPAVAAKLMQGGTVQAES